MELAGQSECDRRRHVEVGRAVFPASVGSVGTATSVHNHVHTERGRTRDEFYCVALSDGRARSITRQGGRSWIPVVEAGCEDRIWFLRVVKCSRVGLAVPGCGAQLTELATTQGVKFRIHNAPTGNVRQFGWGLMFHLDQSKGQQSGLQLGWDGFDYAEVVNSGKGLVVPSRIGWSSVLDPLSCSMSFNS
ncbi:hypothetical protein R1flu_020724 [Riccia fluitans]|uniref:Uncharacterized protein n=1 Tax=Riccia fluitans TaxID=41844 RepID=A0ABD1ZPE3_9MARC